jgi:hypothetical protein
MTHSTEWPSFARHGAWPATQDYLHLVTQMLGKLRLALHPPLPQWSHTPLGLTSRGLTTRAIPIGRGSVEASLDLLDGVVRLAANDGATRTVEIAPARTIAAIWADVRRALDELCGTVSLWDKPQERDDATPFAQDDRPRTCDAALARGWLALLTELSGIFEAWRSPFFGRSGVNFWWGGFDFTVNLFNGRHATPRAGSDYLMRHDLDAEHLSVGFWPGDDANAAMFFGYLVPEPPGCASYPVHVEAAGWASTMGEWVLPYEALRRAPARYDQLAGFLSTIHRAADELAGWDFADLSYERPGPLPRTRG